MEAVLSLTLDKSLGLSFLLMELGSWHDAEKEVQRLNLRPQGSLGHSPGHNIHDYLAVGQVGLMRDGRRQKTSWGGDASELSTQDRNDWGKPEMK